MPEGHEATAVSFYQDLLGIPQVQKPEPLATRGGCWFIDKTVAIHLLADPSFQPSTRAHPALIVANLDELIHDLEAAGYPTRPGENTDGHRRAFVNDPFGNRLELTNRYSD